MPGRRPLRGAGVLGTLLALAGTFATPILAQTLDAGYVASPALPRPANIKGVALQPDGMALFTTTSPTSSPFARRLTTTGTVDPAFSEVSCAVDAFNQLTGTHVQADGRLLFSSMYCANFNGAGRKGFARYSASGVVDAGFDPALIQMPGSFGGAIVQPDGKVLVYGEVTSENARGGLLRLLANGQIDTSFSGLLQSDRPTAIALQPDGRILSIHPNTAGMPNLFRIAADGTVEAQFDPGADFYLMDTLLLQPDGKVVAHAYNMVVNAEVLVRFNIDGTLDGSFQQPHVSSANFDQVPIALLADGKFLVGGGTTVATGGQRVGLARLNPDGTLDTAFQIAVAGSGVQVGGLAVQGDGKILIGGNFSTVAGTARAGVARVIPAEAVTQAVVVGSDNASLLWQRSGPAPEFERTTFEFSNDGASWTALGAGAHDGSAWSLAGLTLPRGETFHIRARGWAASGHGGRSRSLNEQTAQLLITPETWDVTASAETGGMIAPSGVVTASHGSTLDFTLTPDLGQVIDAVAGTCGGTLNGSVFTTEPVTASCTVIAQFTTDSTRYTVHPAVVAGQGTIDPSTDQLVPPGSRIAFTLAPVLGWHVDSIGGTCGGSLASNVYTTEPVAADCSVEAHFAINAYTVDAQVITGLGSIDPTSQQVDHGGVITFDLAPGPGFGIGEVTGCGGTLNGLQYVTAPVAGNCTVEASFVSSGTGQADLHLTLAPWDGVPGTTPDCSAATTTLVVESGDRVALCVTYINNTDQTLDWMYLTNSKAGLRTYPNYYSLAPGESIGPGQASGVPGAPFVARAYRFYASETIEATWTGLASPPPTYSFDDTVPFEWIELTDSPTATQLDLTTDRGDTAESRMPFAFDFFGRRSQDLCISQDGGILVGRRKGQLERDCKLAITSESTPPMLGGAHFRELLIAPAWMVGGYRGGRVLVDTQGTAPNRRYIVQWSNVEIGWEDAPLPISFQAVIDETSNQITFQYLTMDAGSPAYYNDGLYAMAGLHREVPLDGTVYPPGPATLPYSQYQAKLTAGKAVRWTPTAQPFSRTTSNTAQVIVAGPSIEVTPTPVQATGFVGGQNIVPVTIHNNAMGEAELLWSLETLGQGTGFTIAETYQPPATLSTEPAASRAWGGGTAPTARSAAINGGGQAPDSAPMVEPAAPTGNAVPAYGLAPVEEVNGTRMRVVALDASSPGTTTQIVGDPRHYNSAEVTAFVDNDFTRLFSMVNQGRNDNAPWDWSAGWVGLDEPNGFITYGPLVRPVVPNDPTRLYWMGMSWDHTENRLYGIASNAGNGADWMFADCGQGPVYPTCRSDLFVIDPDTATSTWIGRLDDVSPEGWGTIIADISISPTGDLYGLEMTTDSLLGIDKLTAHVRPIGPTGLNVGWWPPQSMDFDQGTGTLYYTTWPWDLNSSYMYSLDTGSGAATTVGQMGSSYILRGLSIAKRGGPCASPEDVPWLSWDQGSGTTPAQQSSLVNLTLDATALSPGLHEARLCVNSNTPLRRTVLVPVHYLVDPEEASIFADGFDGQ